MNLNAEDNAACEFDEYDTDEHIEPVHMCDGISDIEFRLRYFIKREVLQKLGLLKG